MFSQFPVIALIIFIISYIGIIFTRLPWVNIDRPSAAFTGAVLMIVAGMLSFDQAIQSIDFNTIGLLLGMMILISVLELDGFFILLARQTMAFSKNPTQFLWFVCLISGLASAFFVNDAVVLLFTPVVIAISRSAKLNPVPFLIAEIFASNIGSTMSMTGNPQNMLIGIQSGISYGRFLLLLAPVSLLGLLLIVPIIKLFYKTEFSVKSIEFSEIPEVGMNVASMKTSVPIFIFVIIAFFFSSDLQLPIPVIALAGGALVLLFGRIKPSKIIKGIDWVLLLFFASLFVLVHGIEDAGYLKLAVESFQISPGLNGIITIHVLSLLMSQLVSNVPFTVVFIPFIQETSNEMHWLSLAAGSTLAGNATIIGAMANLIVIEVAAGLGVKISFMEFLRPGLIITFITLLISILWIYAIV